MSDEELLAIKVLKLADRWWGMHRRINNPEYYGQGSRTHAHIEVCPEWHGTAGRQAFVLWSLKNGFSPELVLDREKNHLGYSPDNCQWITSRENSAKEKRFLEYQGARYTQTELVEKFGHPSLNVTCFRGRLKLGWALEEALSTPLSHGNRWTRGNKT